MSCNTVKSKHTVVSQEILTVWCGRWFKGYFAWVNNAPCEHCGSAKTSGAGGDKPNAIEKGFGAGAVELYTCADCAKTTRFPRYNHPGKLMETRKGTFVYAFIYVHTNMHAYMHAACVQIERQMDRLTLSHTHLLTGRHA